jgi:hypothetical protein
MTGRERRVTGHNDLTKSPAPPQRLERGAAGRRLWVAAQGCVRKGPPCFAALAVRLTHPQTTTRPARTCCALHEQQQSIAVSAMKRALGGDQPAARKGVVKTGHERLCSAKAAQAHSKQPATQGRHTALLQSGMSAGAGPSDCRRALSCGTRAREPPRTNARIP